MSPQWKYLGVPEQYRKRKFNVAEKPSCLDEMLAVSERLSSAFPFVRVDFYIVDSRPVFGELTFTPSSGVGASEINVNGNTMGDLLVLP